MTRPHGRLWRRDALLFLAAAISFFVLATANSTGYRYGVSDQAFYIPAIRQDIDPSLFPRDTNLVAPQARLLALDEIVASIVHVTGLRLETIFLIAYTLTVLVFAAGVFLVGNALFASRWATWALLLALTLRHRITETGVNTFEGYFHPRVLAFALGIVAVGLWLRQWRAGAALTVGAAFLVHPTTALWFGIWMGAGTALASKRWRTAMAIGVGLAVVGACLAWFELPATPLRAMDPAWTAVLVDKDYLFPSDWPFSVWLVQAIAPTLIAVISVRRRRMGFVRPMEDALSRGALVALFVVSLPFIDARVALPVQLQTSRVLWPVEFLATAYLIWCLFEAPWAATMARWQPSVRAAVLVIAVLAAARGFYVLRIEHDRGLVEPALPETSWQAAANWAAGQTPTSAHFLVDPGHAWKYGVSFRIAAGRDVFLEEVKDAAMATYDRDVAMRVAERIRALDGFTALSVERIEQIAHTYDLDYLVTDRSYPLPLVFSNQQFRVYDLDPSN